MLSGPGHPRATRCLVEQRVRCRLQLTAIEDVLFPELKDFFKTSVTSSSAGPLLESFPTPNHVAAPDPGDLHRVVVSQGHARRLAARLMDLQLAGADSAGLATDTIVNTQEWMLYQLRLLDDQIEQVEAAIGAVLEEWPPQDRLVLASFPAMTIMRQAVLLASIGDIACFRDDRQLRKLLGWYPEARESGSSISRHPPRAQRKPLGSSRALALGVGVDHAFAHSHPLPRLLPPSARPWHGWPRGHGTSGRQAHLRPFLLSAQRDPL